MICLAAAIGVLGFAAMGRARRHCHGHHGYGWHGPYGDGDDGLRGRHGGGRRRLMLRALFHRLDATPAQERAIIAEIEKAQDRVTAAGTGVHEARGDLAAALRGAVLDDAALGAVLGRTDTTVSEARAALIDALRGVHAVLDDRQRGELADLVEHGGRWWRRSGRRSGGDPVRV